MVEIKNKSVCTCFDLDIKEAIIKEYFKDVLKKVPNSLSGDDFSSVLVKYLKKLQNKKLEDLDVLTKSLSEKSCCSECYPSTCKMN
ncbi:hypothetical protein ANME2D_00225, partial [Candidatus Methanoperedens nitroreducens]